MTTDPQIAAARIRTYLRLTPTAHTLGGEIAYSEEFRSDDWPRSCYAPTREDVEALLAAVPGRADTLRMAADVVAADTEHIRYGSATDYAERHAALLRRLAAGEPQQRTADGSDEAEPDVATGQCGHDDYHGAHEWADRPNVWCPGHSLNAGEPQS